MSKELPYDPTEDDPKPRVFEPYVEKQTNAGYLMSHGIVPARTEDGNRNMVLFIKKGNLTTGSNIPQRIEIVKQAQATWLGKRVKNNQTNDSGTVTSVSFRSPDRVIKVKKYRQEHGNNYTVSPYELGVSWDDRINRGRTSIYGLEILPDPASDGEVAEKED
jgi:hypothetical protein